MSSTITVPKGSPFTLHNVPFGVISTASNPEPRCATAIGDCAVDLAEYWSQSSLGNLDSIPVSPEALHDAFKQPHLNTFAALPTQTRSAVREHLIGAIRDNQVPESCLIPLDAVRMHLPMKIGGYSDFYCSLEHCRNCIPMTGGMTNNFFHAPSVYNGRVSSIIPSPQSVRRPKGVMYDTGKNDGNPVYGPSKKLDFELEMGYFVSRPIDFGETMNADDAQEHIFGFVLLNDWSARDIQSFELKPLGPFHSKGFGTSISPWIITLDALKPFACEPKHDHTATDFEHLKWNDRQTGAFDIRLAASLIRNQKHYPLTETNLRFLYWTPYQQLAHHAAAGCGMETGDILGSGTISGETKGMLGCLFEATQDGSQPIEFPDGTQVDYLMDNDHVVLEGWCGDEQTRIGFGECRGLLLPSRT